MPELTRWEPYRGLSRMRDAMDRLFDDALIRPTSEWPGFGREQPALDMYQTDKDVVVKAALPGIKPEEVNVSVTGDTLTIEAEHKEEEESKEKEYFHREQRYSFTRTVGVPVEVDSDNADATLENGVLTLTLPKTEKTKAKQINVKPKGMIEGEKKK